MKKEKECYEVPCADIVDIRMEGSLLVDSMTGENEKPGEHEMSIDVTDENVPSGELSSDL